MKTQTLLIVDDEKATREGLRAALEERYGDDVMPPLRTSVRVSEAPGHGRFVLDYAPGSTAAEDFERIVDSLDRS